MFSVTSYGFEAVGVFAGFKNFLHSPYRKGHAKWANKVISP
jgi:hypothetical protein